MTGEYDPVAVAADPAVRAAVLGTVTLAEASRVLRSRAGKPWCDAMLLRFGDDLSTDPETSVSDGVREVLGVPTEAETRARVLELRRARTSYRAIAAVLDAEGHRPRRAACWSPSTVRSVVQRAQAGA